MKLTAKFATRPALEAALRSAACARAVVYSSKPVELASGARDRPGRMSLLAVTGAVAAGAGMTLFMLWTQGDYPLVTGGMPLQSLWPIGVVTYEATMLGAVAGTLLGFLGEGRFFRKKSAPGEAVDSAWLFLQLPCQAGEADRLAEQLRAAGAVSVEREQD